MKTKLLKIATRQSKLALWQASFIKQQLLAAYPDLQIELLPLLTAGDKNLAASLSKSGGKGLFVKELEQALLRGEADIAVHSMKDVPAEFPSGLGIAAICRRDDVRDVFISENYANLASLPVGASIGTSSLRRACQLHALRPEIAIKPLRGNIDTRLQRLAENTFDAIILAAAGLERLGIASQITEYFSTELFLPAVGQGALGVECRLADADILAMVSALNHQPTYDCVQAERAMNHHLNGGCQLPIAGYAQIINGQLTLYGMVGSADGHKIIKAHGSDSVENAEQLGQAVAKKLLDQGAGEILKQV